MVISLVSYLCVVEQSLKEQYVLQTMGESLFVLIGGTRCSLKMPTLKLIVT